MNIISKISLGASLQEIIRSMLPPESSSGLDENPDVDVAGEATASRSVANKLVHWATHSHSSSKSILPKFDSL